MMAPGDSACVAVGTPCGVDRFPTTTGPTVFVDATATGGDGSLDHPFPTLTEAIAATPDQGTIAIATGQYAEVLDIDRPIHLVGVCSSEVELLLTDSSSAPLVTLSSAGASLRNLSMTANGVAALRIEADGTLEGIEVRGGRILFVGGEVTVDGLSIRSASIANPNNNQDGLIDISGGARATLQRVAIVDVIGTGVRVAGVGSHAALADIVVDDAKFRLRPSSYGRGFVVRDDATLHLERAVVQRYSHSGIHVTARGHVEVRDSLFRESRPVDGRKGGYGIDVEGGTASLSRTVYDRVSDEAVRTDREGARLELEDVLIRDIQLGNDARGRSLVARDLATLIGSRVEIENSVGSAIYVNAAQRVELDDLSVRWETSSAEGAEGMDTRFAPVVLNRSEFSRSRGIGILSRSGGELTLNDLSVKDTRSDLAGGAGHGLVVQAGGSVVLRRGEFRRNREAATALFDTETTTDFADVRIDDTLGRDADDTFGTGILVSGATLALTRASLTSNRGLGLHLARSSRVTIQHLNVSETAPQTCSTTSCRDMPFGYGIASLQDSIASVDTFRVSQASLCGVILATNGELDLFRGTVSDSSLGACIQNDGYDVGRLTNDVTYRDNGRNLDTTSLPVPSAEPLPVIAP